jgi:hypothetical protein
MVPVYCILPTVAAYTVCYLVWTGEPGSDPSWSLERPLTASSLLLLLLLLFFWLPANRNLARSNRFLIKHRNHWSDCTVIMRNHWSDCTVIMRNHWSDFTVIMRNHWSDCTVIMRNLWSDCPVIMRNHWSDCTVIMRNHWSDCTVLFYCDLLILLLGIQLTHVQRYWGSTAKMELSYKIFL